MVIMSEEKALSMEEEALKRKERLKALKRNVNKQESAADAPSATDSSQGANKK